MTPDSSRRGPSQEYAASLRSSASELEGTLIVRANRMVFVSRRLPVQGVRAHVQAPSCPDAIPPVVVGRVLSTALGEFEAELLLDSPLAGPPSRPSQQAPTSSRKLRRVLLIDDSELLIALTTAVLTSAGYGVTSTTSPFEARSHIRAQNPDLVLIDFNIPALRGDVLIENVKRDGIKTPMVLYSSAPERVLLEAMTRSGAFAYIRKGVGPQLLVKELDEVYRRMGRA